jgi:hypothetical protein
MNEIDKSTQMTHLMCACYQGNISEVQKMLQKDISEREIYNCLIMCQEGEKHNPTNVDYLKIIEAIKQKYPKKIRPHSGQYAEFVMLDCRGPRVKYTLYVGGEFKGLI